MIVDKARLHAAAAMKAIEPTNRIYNVVSELMSQIRANVIKELEDQGHVLSGSLINSIETKTGIYSNKIRGVLSMNMYGMAQETGIPASNIPFNEPSNRGGTSDYIEALIGFFVERDADDPVSAAFATASVHRKEGMPTKASSRFSSSGRRTGFVSHTVFEEGDSIDSILNSIFDATVTAYFNEIDYGKES